MIKIKIENPNLIRSNFTLVDAIFANIEFIYGSLMTNKVSKNSTGSRGELKLFINVKERERETSMSNINYRRYNPRVSASLINVNIVNIN